MKFRIFVVVILYQVYLLAPLGKSYTVPGRPDSPSSSVSAFTPELLPPPETQFLLTQTGDPVLKVKISQVKYDCVEIGYRYFNLKTYMQDNDLHYNLPLILYKFAVSQQTADG